MSFLRRARSGRQAARRRTAAASAFVTLAALAVTLPQTGAAVAATDPCRQPTVRDVMISQGLPSYGTLARGKTALVKFFLSEPSSSKCANVSSESTSITGGRLTITNAGAATSQRVLLDVTPSGALPEFSGYEVAPVTATPSDPRFVVPGSLLSSAAPAHAASTYGVTFSAELDYVVRNSSGVVASGTLPVTARPDGRPLDATVSKPVKPLRLLVVPMGNPDVTTPEQFPSAAATEVTNGLSAVSRQLPIADGLGSLASTAGLRWHLSAGMVDLGPHQEGDAATGTRTVNYMTNGTFCGGGASFDYIQKQLSQFRSAWNAENPTEPVDRVLGVVWRDISRGAQTSDGSCAEGYAGLGGSVAWARVLPPTASRLGVTGSLATLELTHGFGGSVQHVSQGASGPVSGPGFPHSFSKTADATAPNRAYNIPERTFLDAGRNRSVSAYDLAPYDDYGTLYEKKDWDFVLCFLTTSSVTPSQDCGSPVSAGASVSAAGGSYVLGGSTDGTAAGTDAHTYFEEDMPRDGEDASSPYRLVQRDAAGAPLPPSTGVRAATVVSEHTHASSQGDVHAGTRAAFDVAIPQRAGAVAFELWKGEPGSAGATLLYRRALDGRAPTFVSTDTQPAPAAPVAYTADGTSRQAAVSPDGGLVAFTTANGVVVARSASGQSRSNVVAGTSAAWNPNGTEIAVVRDGEVFLVPVTVPATGAPALGAPRKVYGSRIGTGTPAAADPAYAPDGSELALSVAGDLFAVNLRLLTPDAYPVLCPLDAIVQDRTGGTSGLACRRLTNDPATEVAPTWSALNGLIAYQRGTDAVWTLSPATPGSTQQARLGRAGDTVTDPAWAGTRLLAVRSRGLLSVDATTFDGLIEMTDGAGDVSPSASQAGSRVLFTRPSAAGTDLFSLELSKQSATATVEDDVPSQLRMDLFVVCGGTADPVVTGARPSRVDEGRNRAEFDLRYDTSRTCADGVLLYRTTDGYSVTRQQGDPVVGTGAPGAAVYVPKPDAVLLQYDSIPVSGAGTSSSGRATSALVWTLTGPGVSRDAGTGTTLPDLVPPAGGWVPGTYTLTVVPDGDAAGAFARTFTISADRDADGIPDARDSRDVFPCFPADAVTSAANALADPDLDLLPSLVDPQPCVSAMNGQVQFNPKTLNLVSNGNPITLTLTTTAVDVRTLQVGDVSISQVGGFDAALPALGITALSPSVLEAKFSRQAFIDYFNARGLLGYVPVVLSASRGGVTARGFDASAPVYQP